MHLLTFFILNCLAAASSYLITSRILQTRRIIDHITCWFLVYLSEIVVSVMALGTDGILNITNLLVLHFLALLFLLIHTRKLQQNVVAPTKPTELLQSLQANRMLRLGLCAIIVFGSMKFLTNLVNAPLGWDCLNYHFVFPVEWIKHANIQVPITINDDPGPTYYPLNGSFWYFWLMIPFRNAFLANIGQIPFFVLLFIMTYATGRALKLNRWAALVPAILFILIPNVFKHLKLAYVDMMVAAYFVTATYFLIRLKEQYQRAYVVAFALSIGLLLGTKTVALPYSFLLIVPFVIISFGKPQKETFKLLASACFLIFLLGSLSYLRNWIETGNPIYPLHIAAFNNVIFKGVIDGTTYRAHFTVKDYALAKMLFHEGLGAQTLFFILPAALLAFPVWLLKKQKRRDWLTGYVLLLPLLLFGIYRFVLPLANTRYLYPCLAIGLVSAMVALHLYKIPRTIITIISTLCIFASIPELDKNIGLTIGILTTTILYFVTYQQWFYKFLIASFKKPLIRIIMCVVGITGLYFLSNTYDKFEFKRYSKAAKLSGFWPEAIEAWGWLNKNTVGNSIAFVGRPVAYPLYGTHYKNDVHYISVNNRQPAKLHFYPDSWYTWGFDFEGQHANMLEDNNYRGKALYATWHKNLTESHIDFLFIYSLHQTKNIVFPIEETWASAHPDVFKLVYANEIVRIYSLMKQ